MPILSDQNHHENIASGSTPVNSPLLETHGLGRTYKTGDHELTVLSGVNLQVAAGQSCAIIGPSGSGKTTLLGLCAGLDSPSSGWIRLGGQRLDTLDEDSRAQLRGRMVGFVFQSFQLIPTLTAIENVLIPLELRGLSGKTREAADLLAQVGLQNRLTHYPSQLSGGEQQRVALARAFIHKPAILFADEPTGNLDAATSEPIIKMLFDLNRENGTALVLVTHDPALARLAGRVISMRAGKIVSQGERHESA